MDIMIATGLAWECVLIAPELVPGAAQEVALVGAEITAIVVAQGIVADVAGLGKTLGGIKND
jgi:hypothetical protein